MKANVLIIDDEKDLCIILSRKIESMGHRTKYALTLQEGYSCSQAEPFDLIYLDVHMPDGNGLEAIQKLRENPSMPEVIIMTGAAEAAGAELAIKSGAWDYIIKPSSLDVMVLPLIRALEYRQAKSVSKQEALKSANIIGSSKAMQICMEQVAHAAGSDANVLVTGETGTGKELISLAVHENSKRAAKSFVVVDCAALSATLVESMLFGYEKGAYTGADRARGGLILRADGGTLFLDEIGELPLAIQKTFLRVLQEKRFRPLGSNIEIESDFRLIAATNRNLEQAAEEGTFRSDLLFRIRSAHIEVPPLRNHLEDIKELTQYYISKLCKRSGIEPKTFSPDFIDVLKSYSWPGNVRELFNALERAMAEALQYPVLYPKHLPTNIRVKLVVNSIDKKQSAGSAQKAKTQSALPKFHDWREKAMAETENTYLLQLISLCNADLKKACAISGLSRSRLYELLKKYEIKH
jgi:two-component system NtrC family response regulator